LDLAGSGETTGWVASGWCGAEEEICGSKIVGKWGSGEAGQDSRKQASRKQVSSIKPRD
jgi:hypothetical protein